MQQEKTKIEIPAEEKWKNGTTEFDRSKNFKHQGTDPEELKRRCNELNFEIRKQKRDDRIFKRRNVSMKNEEDNLVNINKTSKSFQAQQHLCIDKLFDMINRPNNVEHLFSAVQEISKILSQQNNPPIEYIINSNLVKSLVKCLELSEHSMLQFEATSAITNIASGTSSQTRHVVESGAILPLVKLLSSPVLNLCNQAVWALGNIAGDGAESRDLIVKYGILEPLLALIQPGIETVFLRNIAWTISNLCRYKNPEPAISVLKQIVPALSFLLSSNDKEVIKDTCWALSYITDGRIDMNAKIDVIIETGAVSRLVELLNLHHKSDMDILRPALRCIGNIVSGKAEHTQCVIDSNFLPVFHELLKHSKINVQKESGWILSNITAGTQVQIQSVIESDLIPLLIQTLANNELKVKREIAWAITNYTTHANTEQVLYLIKCQVIKPICDLLFNEDYLLIKILLDALYNILFVSEKVGQLEMARLYFEEIDDITKIEKLQYSENEDINKLAFSILEKFFDSESDSDAEYLRPRTTSIENVFESSSESSLSNIGANTSKITKFLF